MQEFFLGHPALIGRSETFQFQMDVCDILVAHYISDQELRSWTIGSWTYFD